MQRWRLYNNLDRFELSRPYPCEKFHLPLSLKSKSKSKSKSESKSESERKFIGFLLTISKTGLLRRSGSTFCFTAVWGETATCELQHARHWRVFPAIL